MSNAGGDESDGSIPEATSGGDGRTKKLSTWRPVIALQESIESSSDIYTHSGGALQAMIFDLACRPAAAAGPAWSRSSAMRQARRLEDHVISPDKALVGLLLRNRGTVAV